MRNPPFLSGVSLKEGIQLEFEKLDKPIE